MDLQEITPLTSRSPCMIGSCEKSDCIILVTALLTGSSGPTVTSFLFAAGKLPIRKVGSVGAFSLSAVSTTPSVEVIGDSFTASVAISAATCTAVAVCSGSSTNSAASTSSTVSSTSLSSTPSSSTSVSSCSPSATGEASVLSRMRTRESIHADSKSGSVSSPRASRVVLMSWTLFMPRLSALNIRRSCLTVTRLIRRPSFRYVAILPISFGIHIFLPAYFSFLAYTLLPKLKPSPLVLCLAYGVEALSRDVQFASDLNKFRRDLLPKLLFQLAVFRAELETFRNGFFFNDRLKVTCEGSTVGSWLWSFRDRIAVRLSFGASFVKFEQVVILSSDWPGCLDPLVGPKSRRPFIQLRETTAFLVFQPPLRFFFQPPLKGINKLRRVGNLTAAPLISNLPLLVPATLVNRLLDAANMLIIFNGDQAGSPKILAILLPICRN